MMRFFRDHPEVQLPWLFYAVPPDPERQGPATVFCDRFWDEREFHLDPELGVVPGTTRPYFGPRPSGPVGALQGDPAWWAQGLDYNTYLAGGYPAADCCCLVETWWRADKLTGYADGDPVTTMPDASGRGRDWGLTGATYLGADQGGPTVLLSAAGTGGGVASAVPQLATFGLYLVALSNARPNVFAGLRAGSNVGGETAGWWQPAGSFQWSDGVGHSAAGTFPFVADRYYLYSVRRDGDRVRLAVNGQVVADVAGTGQLARTVAALFTTGGIPPPFPPTQFCFVSVPEAIVLGCGPSDDDDAYWTNYLITKYQTPDWRHDVATVGSILWYAGGTPPPGYLVCDGSAVSRSTYAALLAAIGVAWGPGDGSTTFNIPDLRGRNPRGVGTGPGLSPVLLGGAGGAEDVTLVAGQLAPHTHTVNDPGHTHTVTDPGHDHGLIGGNNFIEQGGGGTEYDIVSPSTGTAVPRTSADPTGVSLSTDPTGLTVNPEGNGDPVPTLDPWAGLMALIYAGA